MKRLLLAVQFLTIIPVRVGGELPEKEIAGSSIFFPVVGALQGLIILLSAVLLSLIFSPDIAAALIIAISVLGNGGFHLDGLADTFDALAVKSSGDTANDKGRRLEVMKDSFTGAIGAVAVVLVILIKYTLLKNILGCPDFQTAVVVLFLMPVYSRWIMVPAMFHGVAARDSGLGCIFINRSSLQALMLSYALTLAAFGGVFLTHILGRSGLQGIYFFAALPAGHLFALACAALCKKEFGGLTGDTLGALSELSELLYLTGAYIWLQRFI
jgi:adenosylcobinamide-GDP ribazoletransferase